MLPSIPVIATPQAASPGIPPMLSATDIAIGVVTLLARRECVMISSTRNSLQRRYTELIAVIDPMKAPAKIGRKCFFMSFLCLYTVSARREVIGVRKALIIEPPFIYVVYGISKIRRNAMVRIRAIIRVCIQLFFVFL